MKPMNQLLIKNANCYIDGAFVKKDLFVIDGKIADFKKACCTFIDCEEVDYSGLCVVPGFIDIHTHGAAGCDVNAAGLEDFETISAFFAKKGVTSYFASILTDSPENTRSILDTIARYKATPHSGAQLLGAHLEGPFLSHAKKGAMPAEYLKEADLKLFESYAESGVVKYITIAPEANGACNLIESIASRVPVAIGHSAATYEQSIMAIASGARVSTHTFNAMEGIDRVEPHILGAALESEIYNEIIADDAHVHPANIRLLYRLKGNQKIIAITDSIAAAGMPDGTYRLGANEVDLQGLNCFVKGTKTRAGSALTMEAALKNLMKFLDISLEEALPMVSQNAADLFGFNKGYIRIGYDADFTVLDKDFNVVHTIIDGVVQF
ncbi:MAG: N-acetylglucosamine-6-phosphate deacetylase [Clostridia bacterium]|nr:N-acetylglucosamine-6-phosphate deacetylase [Clostridia bacterium]